METWFWCATVDNYEKYEHSATPSASGIVQADNAEEAFDFANKEARNNLCDKCTFTITQFNKVS
jgi:hypothetical protein